MACSNAKEYAIYTVDNMHRASLANALNIAKSLTPVGSADYSIDEYLDSMDEYVTNLVSSGKMAKIKACRILVEIADCKKKLVEQKSDFGKTMHIDTFIIKLWRAYQ